MARQAYTTKQLAFVECYFLEKFNGTKAAGRAGYEGDDNTLAVIASENLRKPKIRALIDQRLEEMTMSANEVLFRLSEEARGDLSEFIGLSTDELKSHPKSYLLKKVKHTVTTRGSGDDSTQTETVELELYDAQAAKVQLGRYHKLFVDRSQVDDWRSEAIQLIKRGEVEFEPLAEELGHDLATELFKGAGVPIVSTGATEPSASPQ